MKNFSHYLFILLFISISNIISAQCPPAGSRTLVAGSTPNTCAGNGTITASVNNTTGISLQLLKSGSILSQVPSVSNPVLTSPYTWSNLQPGNDYQVKVICSDDQSIVYASQYVTIIDNYIPISDADISATNACGAWTAGGTITVNSVSGGTAPYTYSAYHSSDPNYDDALSNYGASNVINVTQYGNYQIRIKDACGNYKTFTRTLGPTITNAIKVYLLPQPICGSSQNDYSLWWNENGDLNEQGGTMLTVYGSDDGVNPTGSPLWSGLFTSATHFQMEPYPTHQYYIESTNPCGVKISYTLDGVNYESPHMWLDPIKYTPNCVSGSLMEIRGDQNGYWVTPITVEVKNSSNVVVYSTTLNNVWDRWTLSSLPMDDYTVTYTDNCGTTDSQIIYDLTGSQNTIELWQSHYLWRCGNEFGGSPQTVTGSTELDIYLYGNVPDKSNAIVTIVSGPSNVGVQGANHDSYYWFWSNILPGSYTISVESCGITNYYNIDVNPDSSNIMQESITSTGTSFCSGGGNITTNAVSNAPGANFVIELYNSSNTLIDSNSSGDFYNLPAGTYNTKMKVSNWCTSSEYYVNGNTVIISDATTGPQITSSVGVICEDAVGNPLTTGSAYLTLAGVTPYTLQYRENGTSTWTTINNAPTNAVIDNLTANTLYDVILMDGCGGSFNSTIHIKTMGVIKSENTSHPCYNSPYVLSVRYYAGATYQWINPLGTTVSTSRSYSIPNYTSANDGIYTVRISWGTCVTRYSQVNINGNLCGTPLDEVFVDAQNDINQTPQAIPVSGNAIYNDSSSDNSLLTIQDATYLNIAGISLNLPLGVSTAIYDSSHILAGSIVLNTDGSYTFTPTASYIGSVPVQYTAVNPTLSTDNATITINVLPISTLINNNPIAQDDAVTAEMNISINSSVLLNDKDPNNNPLTVTSAGIPLNAGTTVSGIDSHGNAVPNAGTLILNSNGTYTFVPTINFIGYIDPIPYTISNGKGGTDSAILTITVFPALGNDTYANDDANSSPRGITMTGNIISNDTDPENDAQTVTIANVLNGMSLVLESPNTIPGVGTLTINTDGSYIFKPLPTYVGTVVIPYTICDISAPQSCDNATLYLTTLPVGPIADNDINQVPSNITATGNILTNDEYTTSATVIDAQYYNSAGVLTTLPLGVATPIYTQTSVPAGTITLNSDGTYTFVPLLDFTGTVPVNYAMEDVYGTDNAILTIEVIAPAKSTENDNPIANDDVSSTEMNTPVSGYAFSNDSDPDSDPLTVTNSIQGANTITLGVATMVSGVDGTGTSVLNAGTITLNSNGIYTYNPAAEFTGTVDPINYTISDGNGGTDNANIYITVYPNYGNTIFANDDANSGIMGTTLTGNILANDTDPEGNTKTVTSATADGTPLVIGSATSIPGVGSLTLNSNGTYTFIPNATYVGTVVVPYTICDNGTPQACDQATLYLTEIPITFTAPIATDDVNTTNVNTPVSGQVLTNDEDPEGDPLTVNSTPIDNPDHGTVVLNADGTYTYTPNPGYVGEDTFIYEVCDPSGACDQATVTIEIMQDPTPSNDPPVAVNDAYTASVNTTVNGDVIVNDFDVDGNLNPTSVTLVNGGTAATNGTLTLNPNGTFTYTPNTGFTGQVNFTYQICDTGMPILCDDATVTIDILPVLANETFATDDAFIGSEDAPINGNVLDNDYDPQGNTQTVNTTPVDAPQHGTVTLNPDGTFTYIPAANYSGQDQFVYEVCDNGTPVACDKATVYLNVAPVNDPPVAVDDVNTTFVDTPVQGQVLTNDSDPEDDTLTVTPQTNAPTTNGGTVTVNPDGTYTYTPPTGFVGEDTFTYQVCDPSGSCDVAKVTIEVMNDPTPNNDPPVAVNDAYTASINTTVNGDVIVNDFDVDNNLNPTSVILTNGGTAVTNGTLVLNPNGTFTYTPNTGFTGQVNFTYQICDTGMPIYCDDATVTIDILPVFVNETYATDDAEIGAKNTPINGNVLDNDYDPQGNTQTVNTTPVDAPQHGTVTLNSDGTFTYIPNTDYVGEDQFVYEVCDNGIPVACDKATVYLTIAPTTPKLWVGTTSTDFNTGTNWTMGTVPNDGDDVEFATNTNNGGNPAVNDMVIPVGSTINIGNLTNESDKATVIPSNTSLTILGEVFGSETDPTKIEILANNDGVTPNGTLILSGQPCAHDVKGTVQMYAKGFKGPKYTWVDNIVGSPTFGVTYTGYYKWQQFGVPVVSVQANPTFAQSYLREYNETQNSDTTYYKKWITLNNSSVLTGDFKGYSITQDAPKIIELQGSLVFCNKNIVLKRTAVEVTNSTDPNENNKRYGLGQNVFGNSFTAAIDISTLNFPANVEQTVYLYNTGSFGEWGNNTSALADTTKSAGSYRAIPYNVAPVIGAQIPSMQGFLLRHLGTFGTEITMEMPYNKLVKNVNPQSVQRKKVSNDESSNQLSYLEIDLNSSSTRDKLWLFSKEGTSINFDNGWDGRKFFGTPTAYIYAPTSEGNMQISTNNNLIGTHINFIGSSEAEYTMTLKKVNIDSKYSNLYLVDLVANTITPLDKEVVTYKFIADNNGTEKQRFQIRGEINSNIDDSELALEAYLNGNGIQIKNNTQNEGTVQLFDVSGKMIMNTILKPLENEPLPVNVVTGVYLVKLSAGKYNNTVKVIIK